MLRSAPLLLGLATLTALAMPTFAASRAGQPANFEVPLGWLQVAQASDAGPSPSLTPPPPGMSASPETNGAPIPQGAVPLPLGTSGSPSVGGGTPPVAKAAPPMPLPPVTTSTRNGPGTLPGMGQPAIDPQRNGAGSITYGGPQTGVQPIYGSTMRDTGAGNGGTPVYSNAPSTLGGPINGTANPYFATQPGGTNTSGQAGGSTGRGSQDNATVFTQKPLGGVPNTRDQTGTFGGRGGYNAQGIYNGTAASSGTGNGYGSPYATSGRPTGGLLSTNVDATGPLRPYIPLNNGPIGRPNSGYGIPNGSRDSHMDGRGIQRVN